MTEQTQDRIHELKYNILVNAIDCLQAGSSYDFAKEFILSDHLSVEDGDYTQAEITEILQVIDAAYGRCYDNFRPDSNTEKVTDIRQFFVEITDEKIFNALIKGHGWENAAQFFEETDCEFSDVKGKFDDIRDMADFVDSFEFLTQEDIDYIINRGEVLEQITGEEEVFFTYGRDNRYSPENMLNYLEDYVLC